LKIASISWLSKTDISKLDLPEGLLEKVEHMKQFG